MSQRIEKRRRQPALSKCSSQKKSISNSAGKCCDQGFFPRHGYGEYQERHHQRAREERDRRLGKTSVTISDDEFEKRLSHICDTSCDRLSDGEWFSKHPLARSRHGGVVAGKDATPAAHVIVALQGRRTITKTYVGIKT